MIAPKKPARVEPGRVVSKQDGSITLRGEGSGIRMAPGSLLLWGAWGSLEFTDEGLRVLAGA